eukprot:TRINITY_DN7074_c0_g1_i1.p1 TRINITY_DN7074_c0_g1~~TRINITY_DN7074_c0_g1_i1.p1  ORF type:complete len:339 (+),score=113.71 TRINITY_DN7074_c0_g1_i1:46-1017(+)
MLRSLVGSEMCIRDSCYIPPTINDPNGNAFSTTTDPDSFTPRASVGTNMGGSSGSGVRAIRASKAAAASSVKASSNSVTATTQPAAPKSAMKKSMASSSATTTPSKNASGTSRRTAGDAFADSPHSGPFSDNTNTKAAAAAKKPFAGGSILLEPTAPKGGPTACPSTMRRASLQISSLQEGGSVANSIEEFMTKKSGVNVGAIKRKAMNSTGLPPSRTSPQLVSIAPPLVGQYQVPWREYRANLHSLRNGELTYRDFVETLVRVAALLYSGSSCLLYTSDAADEEDSVDLGGRRIIKKKKKERTKSVTQMKNKKREDDVLQSK